MTTLPRFCLILVRKWIRDSYGFSSSKRGFLWLEVFPEKEAAVAGRVVSKCSKDGLSEPLVETACLETEGVEPYSAAAALDGFLFCLRHQLTAQACAAKFVGQIEQFDVQMRVTGATPESAE